MFLKLLVNYIQRSLPGTTQNLMTVDQCLHVIVLMRNRDSKIQ